MRGILLAVMVVAMVVMAGTAAAVVEEDWPLGVTNTHPDPHVLVDFEECANSYDPIVCPIPGITFETMGGNPWVYGCNDGHFNLRNATHGTGSYVINGYAGAWCGTLGSGGKVVFDDPVSHVSCLASMGSNLIMEAYDNNDNEITNSSWASSNTGEYNFTRISVDRTECDISYVVIHDTGNRWVIDDLVVTTGTVISIGDAFNNDTIPVVVRGAENLGSCQITLSFNSSITNVTGVSGGDMDSMFSNLEDVGEGMVRIGAYQTNNSGIDGEFVLANVSFERVGDGSYYSCPLNITVTTLKDSTPAGLVMEYNVNNGTYCYYDNGDVNGDDVVDMYDAMYLAKNVIGIPSFSIIIECATDVDGNGITDINDASYLARYVIGIAGYEELK